ncbi:unnamed protein product [Euphydryas editha]|uniref:Uncharacterized protein n=1 Tax=Euphydryas editha TaxID=104508 RepID=A0AAU9UM98_EUPED|nr:unnamed protein product [Euphydryas editha]
MATMDLTNEVVRLRAELEKVSSERDMLLCEVSNLRRELELSELKNLHDDSVSRVFLCLEAVIPASLLPLFTTLVTSSPTEIPPLLEPMSRRRVEGYYELVRIPYSQCFDVIFWDC